MKTFLANTLTKTAKTDDNRFEMTFVDAHGKRYTVSIPSAIAADLVPLLEQVAADQVRTMAELTRVPKACAVGHAVRDRKVLLRFDDEPPYAIGLETAAALGRALQEETELVSDMPCPALH
jgi:hypothetical protein